MTDAAAVYDRSAVEGWARGPEPVYALLARELVRAGPDLRGRRCLDLGAGTGVVARQLVSAGAQVVQVDASLPMLAWRRDERPPALVGDALRLPLRDGAVDAVVSAFCLNHIDDVVAAAAELRRVLRPGGRLVASTWANGGSALKAAVEAAVRAHGWSPPEWYAEMRAREARSGGADAMVELLARGGLPATAGVVEVELTVDTDVLAHWRLGMPHTAPWLAGLPAAAAAEVGDDVRATLAAGGPWTERMLVLDAVAG